MRITAPVWEQQHLCEITQKRWKRKNYSERSDTIRACSTLQDVGANKLLSTHLKCFLYLLLIKCFSYSLLIKCYSYLLLIECFSYLLLIKCFSYLSLSCIFRLAYTAKSRRTTDQEEKTCFTQLTFKPSCSNSIARLPNHLNPVRVSSNLPTARRKECELQIYKCGSIRHNSDLWPLNIVYLNPSDAAI